jgi:hypothetical protein
VRNLDTLRYVQRDITTESAYNIVAGELEAAATVAHSLVGFGQKNEITSGSG